MSEEKNAATKDEAVVAPENAPLPGELRAEDYEATVRDMVNEMAQVASVPIEKGRIGAVSVIAVSPSGEFVGSHVIEKVIPQGDLTPEVRKLLRKKLASRLQLLTELQRQIDVLKAQILEYIT